MKENPEIVPETKMPLTSHNIADERVAALRALFPEAWSEGALDTQKLSQLVGQSALPKAERYGLSWAGKAQSHSAVQSLSTGTLRPAPAESVNFDASGNLIIEGDNLEVLKLLQKSYARRVKMIYIDPPYNTGNEFIYPDNFREGLQTYLEYSGQVQSGVRQSTNAETNGRFHSNWLNMMYPRLFLARNLLKDDGVIFISIDDHEVHNLRLMMNEIYGEENFVAQIVWDLGSGTAAGHFTRGHEYVIAYARLKTSFPNFSYHGNEDLITERALKRVTAANPASEITFPAGIEFEGTDAVFVGKFGNSEVVEVVDEKMEFLNSKLAKPVTLRAGWAMRNQILSWLEGEETYDTKGQKVTRFYFDRSGRLQYEKERGVVNPPSVMRRIASTRRGQQELTSLIGENVFSFPKPVEVLSYLINLATAPKDDDIILDFFAGSGTTAQAVLELNEEDGGNRRFILVQLPEPTGNAEYATIADITRERVRRVIAKMNAADKAALPLNDRTTPDRGFKAFTLDSSNFKVWDGDTAPTDAAALAAQLELFASHRLPHRSSQDIVWELLLKSGRPLSVAIEKRVINGQAVYLVEGGALLIYLEEPIQEATLDAMIALAPQQVICLDAAFEGNDQLKNNIVLQMRDADIIFRTV